MNKRKGGGKEGGKERKKEKEGVRRTKGDRGEDEARGRRGRRRER